MLCPFAVIATVLLLAAATPANDSAPVLPVPSGPTPTPEMQLLWSRHPSAGDMLLVRVSELNLEGIVVLAAPLPQTSITHGGGVSMAASNGNGGSGINEMLSLRLMIATAALTVHVAHASSNNEPARMTISPDRAITSNLSTTAAMGWPQKKPDVSLVVPHDLAKNATAGDCPSRLSEQRSTMATSNSGDYCVAATMTSSNSVKLAKSTRTGRAVGDSNDRADRLGDLAQGLADVGNEARSAAPGTLYPAAIYKQDLHLWDVGSTDSESAVFATQSPTQLPTPLSTWSSTHPPTPSLYTPPLPRTWRLPRNS